MGKQTAYRIDGTVTRDGKGFIVKAFRASPIRGHTISISVNVEDQDRTAQIRDFLVSLLAHESLKVDRF
jgi:hypothetical protein